MFESESAQMGMDCKCHSTVLVMMVEIDRWLNTQTQCHMDLAVGILNPVDLVLHMD